MLRKFCLVLILISLFALAGCAQSLQRGMLGNDYVSTARPSITLGVKDMPLMASGQGYASVFWTGMLGGLPIQMWMAIYGEGGLAPLALVAQAEAPQGWYWDGMMRRPFSVDEGTEAYNGVTYDAWTYIVNPERDPFGQLVTSVQPDGRPQLWVARAFAARYNFNLDKIILEYREPLPAAITNLTALPLGYSDFLQQFAQRARSAFVVGPGPVDPSGVRSGYIQGVQWQYIDQNFLGSASRNDFFNNY